MYTTLYPTSTLQIILRKIYFIVKAGSVLLKGPPQLAAIADLTFECKTIHSHLLKRPTTQIEMKEKG